jgi:hypothetical protein
MRLRTLILLETEQHQCPHEECSSGHSFFERVEPDIRQLKPGRIVGIHLAIELFDLLDPAVGPLLT